MTDTSNHKTERHEQWGRAATGWKLNAEFLCSWTLPVTNWMIDAISPEPGESLLELAAGPGDVGFRAAELIEPDGVLICSDFIPEMLSAARERAALLKIKNIDFRQIDAGAIDLETASVDGVLCRWGYSLVPDPQTAMRETRRVLKPGGQVALAAWGSPHDNLWSVLAPLGAALEGMLNIAEEPPEQKAGQFAWADKEKIVTAFQVAGFTEFEIESLTFNMTFPSFEAWWKTIVEISPDLMRLIPALDPSSQGRLKTRLRGLARDFIQPDGMVIFPARTWVAWGKT